MRTEPTNWRSTIIELCILVAITIYFSAKFLVNDDPLYIDWVNWAWLIGRTESTFPNWFIFDTSLGIADAQPAFYAGGLLLLLHSFQEIFGLSTTNTAKLAWFIAIFLRVWGTYLLARSLNIAKTVSFVVAGFSASFPYYLSNLYARGSLGEFFFLSMIPMYLYLAHQIAIRKSYAKFVWVVPATFVLVTSHTLSLFIFGSSFFLLVGLWIVQWYLFREKSKSVDKPRNFQIELSGFAYLFAATLMGFLIALPQLLPLIVIGKDTFFANSLSTETVKLSTSLTPLSSVFQLARETAPNSSTPGLVLSVPVVAVLATALAIVIDRKLVFARAFSLISFTFVALILISNPSVYDVLPKVFSSVQFTYRWLGPLEIALLILLITTFVSFSNSNKLRSLVISAMFVSIGLSANQMLLSPRVDMSSSEYVSQIDAKIMPDTWYQNKGLYSVAGIGEATCSLAGTVDAKKVSFTVIEPVEGENRFCKTGIYAPAKLLEPSNGKRLINSETGEVLLEVSQSDSQTKITLQQTNQGWVRISTLFAISLTFLWGFLAIYSRSWPRHDSNMRHMV